MSKNWLFFYVDYKTVDSGEKRQKVMARPFLFMLRGKVSNPNSWIHLTPMPPNSADLPS